MDQFTIAGQVVDTDGNPLTGTLTFTANTAGEQPVGDPVEVVTDTDGRFSTDLPFSDPADGADMIEHWTVAAPDGRTAQMLAPAATESTEPIPFDAVLPSLAAPAIPDPDPGYVADLETRIAALEALLAQSTK